MYVRRNYILFNITKQPETNTNIELPGKTEAGDDFSLQEAVKGLFIRFFGGETKSTAKRSPRKKVLVLSMGRSLWALGGKVDILRCLLDPGGVLLRTLIVV